MAEDNVTDDTTTDDTTDGASEASSMRATIDRLNAANAAKDKLLRSSAYRTAGLDPETPGIGKAVAAVYDGYDPAEITRIATDEFGWSPPTPDAAPTTAATVTPDLLAAAVINGDQAIGQVLGNTQSIASTKSMADQIAEAEAAGNWTRAIELQTTGITPEALNAAGYL